MALLIKRLIKKLMKKLSKNLNKKLKTTHYLTSFYLLKKLRLVYFGLNSRAIFNTFHYPPF